MSNEEESEIPVNVISKDNTTNEEEKEDNKELSLEFLKTSLEEEKQKSQDLENKLKHAIADYQNLSRKTQSEIETGINNKISQFMLEFLKIYDDFNRAKEILSVNEENAKGLDSILKNMDSLLAANNIVPIDAIGEIFDPNQH